MRLNKKITIVLLPTLFLIACNQKTDNNALNKSLFEYNDNLEARWSSGENMNGAKGAGGKENNMAKGHAWDSIQAGASFSLLDIKEQGIINRIWVTTNDRTPEMLRSLKIEMFWDGESKPAVSVPFGDFFGNCLGKTTAFQNALFANAEGRSFNSFIQMPFKKGAKIIVTNESAKTLKNIFFDVDFSLLKTWNDDYLYFHAYWHRDTATKLATDYELLPQLTGKGRFLGVNIGVNGNPVYKNSWFGEGEVKMYIDGDKTYPTLNGTGTEDYIATAYGQGKFINNYAGCTIADDSLLQWAFYRFHIPDPIFFKTDCRITIQQLGGDETDKVAEYQQAKAPIIPVTTDNGSIHAYYKKDSIVTLDSATKIKGWTNFYRSDDVSATAYFYLDKPVNNLAALQGVKLRTAALRNSK